MGEVRDRETAVELAKDYADEECVGQFGETVDVRREDSSWVVEFKTHTYSDEYVHRLKITSTGNVYAHERSNRFD